MKKYMYFVLFLLVLLGAMWWIFGRPPTVRDMAQQTAENRFPKIVMTPTGPELKLPGEDLIKPSKVVPSINASDPNGQTLLMWAAVNSRPEVIGALVASGAAINAKDKQGRTALRLATERDLSANVKLLLDLKADINTRDKDGRTPLMVACVKGCPRMVRLLKERGSNAAIKDKNGQTALKLSQDSLNRYQETVNILKK